MRAIAYDKLQAVERRSVRRWSFSLRLQATVRIGRGGECDLPPCASAYNQSTCYLNGLANLGLGRVEIKQRRHVFFLHEAAQSALVHLQVHSGTEDGRAILTRTRSHGGY